MIEEIKKQKNQKLDEEAEQKLINAYYKVKNAQYQPNFSKSWL